MEMLLSLVSAYIATAAFAVLFHTPKKIAVVDGVIGALGWIVFLYVRDDLYLTSFIANFVGSLAIGLTSEMSARIFRQPVTVFVVPGIIPLVPGLGLYKGMYAFINNNYDSGVSSLLTAMTDSIAIAIGVMMISSMFRVFKMRKDRRFLLQYSKLQKLKKNNTEGLK